MLDLNVFILFFVQQNHFKGFAESNMFKWNKTKNKVDQTCTLSKRFTSLKDDWFKLASKKPTMNFGIHIRL